MKTKLGRDSATPEPFELRRFGRMRGYWLAWLTALILGAIGRTIYGPPRDEATLIPTIFGLIIFGLFALALGRLVVFDATLATNHLSLRAIAVPPRIIRYDEIEAAYAEVASHGASPSAKGYGPFGISSRWMRGRHGVVLQLTGGRKLAFASEKPAEVVDELSSKIT